VVNELDLCIHFICIIISDLEVTLANSVCLVSFAENTYWNESEQFSEIMWQRRLNFTFKGINKKLEEAITRY